MAPYDCGGGGAGICDIAGGNRCKCWYVNIMCVIISLGLFVVVLQDAVSSYRDAVYKALS
jgi:hypothetical protein